MFFFLFHTCTRDGDGIHGLCRLAVGKQKSGCGWFCLDWLLPTSRPSIDGSGPLLALSARRGDAGSLHNSSLCDTLLQKQRYGTWRRATTRTLVSDRRGNSTSREFGPKKNFPSFALLLDSDPFDATEGCYLFKLRVSCDYGRFFP